jgi:hypothetical protein
MKPPAWRPAPLKAGETRATDSFPGHRRYPVSVDSLDGIEAVAFAIRDLHDAMTKLSPLYRVLATTMMSDEVGEILKMIQDDQLEYAAEPHRGLPPVTSPARRAAGGLIVVFAIPRRPGGD